MKSLYATALLLLATAAPLAALDYYWVGGSGAWSDFSHHWAKIPNPTLPAHYHANVPTAGDDVYFGDTNGGAAYTVNVDAGSTVPKCRNMDWTGVPAGTVWGGGGGRMDIYGALTMDANMSITYSGEVHFIAFGSVSSILSDGVAFPGAVFFEGTTGGWSLSDGLMMYGSCTHTGGALATNGHTVYGGYFYGVSPGSLDLGDSDFYVPSTLARFHYAPADFNAGTSHIICSSGSLEGSYTSPTTTHFYDVSFFGNAGNGFAWGSVDGTLTFHDFGIIHSYLLNAPPPILNKVVFHENGLIYNANNYKDLTFAAGKTYVIQNYSGPTGTDQTILPGGSLTALGAGTCAQFITIKSAKYGTHFNLVNNSGAKQTVHCAILEDCHATGADPLEVLDGVDLGNNTGWNFVNPHGALNLYWVGGAGNWNDPCHWTSNPAKLTGDCDCIPNGATNVFFTANSGFSTGSEVIAPVDAYCHQMDWTGVTGVPKFILPVSKQLFIYDSLTLVPPAQLIWENNDVIHFRGFDNDNVIRLAGQSLDRYLIFEGPGETRFGDAFSSKFAVIHTNGKIKTMGFPVELLRWYGNWDEIFQSSGSFGGSSTELWLGDPMTGVSSTLTFKNGAAYAGYEAFFQNEYLAGKFHALQSHLIYQGDASNRTLTRHSSAIHDYWKITCTYGNFEKGNILDKLTFTSRGNIDVEGYIHEVEFYENAQIRGNHSFDIMTIRGGYFYQLFDNDIQTINTGGTINVLNANCSQLAYIFVDNPAHTAKIAKTGGALNLHDVILDNVLPDLSTGATYSATNSVGIQPQVISDWNIANSAPRNLFWVGGSGTWHDGSHWSLASGGAGGECPPTPADNVRFDAASGLGAGSVVDVTQHWAFCKDMDWTGVTGGAKFYTVLPPYTPNQMTVFGNLTFSSGMVNDFAGDFWLRAKGPATITSAGQHYKHSLHFYEPAGDWTLADPLFVDYAVTHRWGKVRTNDQPIQVVAIWSAEGAQAEASTELFLGSSTLSILGEGAVYGAGYADMRYQAGKVHPGTSHLILGSIFSGRLLSYNEFYNVTFKGNGSQLLSVGSINNLIFEKTGTIGDGNGAYIHSAEFYDDVIFYDSRSYHSIKFAPGKRYTFTAGTTQTISPHAGVEGQFIAQGLPGQYIEMKSSDPNTPAVIHMDDYNGTSTCTKYLFLTGMQHTGTEDIYVPTPGGNVFNSTGWQFFPCNPCPATIPVLDATNSITVGCPPGKAKLVLAGLKPDEWAVWYDNPAATGTPLYFGGTPGPAGNLFQPDITGPATYYARVYSDGGLCESTAVLSVDITITTPPAAFTVTGGGLVCAGANGAPVGLSGSAIGVSYQLQRDGSDVGSPLTGTGAALDFGLQSAPGSYTVVATTNGTACPAVMTGAAVVTGSPNQAPTVAASSNAPLCTPADLYLFESGGAASSWAWTGPGGFVSTDQNPVRPNAVPAHSGTYTVVVSDGLGCTNIASVAVAVSVPYVANCPTDTGMCINHGLFDLEGGGWPTGGTFSGPGVSQNQFDPAVAGPGAHVLSYAVNDPNNCPVSCTFTYYVYNLPVMDCPNDSTLCLGASTPFALAGGSPANGTYSGPGVTAGVFDAAAAGIGQHQITYTASAKGCKNTCTFTYTVSGDQTPTLTVQPPVATLYVSCEQGPPPPNATALDYQGNPLPYTLTEVTSPGNCTQDMVLVRTYTVEDPNATCNNSAQFVQTIYVQDNQAPVLFGLNDITLSSADPLPPPSVSAQDNCDPAPALTFSDVTIPGACPVGYVIVRTWTAVDDCGNLQTGMETITVMAQAAIAGDLSICAGQGTVLTASGGVSYAWSPGGGNTPSITVLPTTTTTYTVTATDSHGCTATASATVAVEPPITFSVTPASPSCNGATDGSLTVGGVSGGQAPYQYALNNNPFQSSPVFAGLGVGAYTIVVADATGCTAQQQATLPQGPDQPLAIQCPAGVPPLTANASCQATLGDYTGLVTLSGGCGIPLNPIIQTPAPGTVINPGTVAITLTVSNVAGQSATCRFNVRVNGGCGGH